MSSGLTAAKQRLREQAEHHLRAAAVEDLRRRHAPGTAAPYRERGDVLWRHLFVPLYRRVPWEAKQRAMHALRMTAEHAGWTAPERRPDSPWQPPKAGT